MQSIRFFLSLLFLFLGQILLLANETSPSLTEQHNLDGKWLFESALQSQQNRLDQVWTSVVSISSDSLMIEHDVGVSTIGTYGLKEVSNDFFEEDVG